MAGIRRDGRRLRSRPVEADSDRRRPQRWLFEDGPERPRPEVDL